MTALLIALLIVAPAAGHSYSRLEGTYTIENGGNAYDVADLIGDWSDYQVEFVAKEIALLNGCKLGTDHEAGKVLRVPRYETTKKFICGDVRNWWYAVKAAEEHQVSPGLLIAIRTHENPKKAREGYGYGVKIVKWQGLEKQAWWSAKIVARVAKRQGWSATSPTRRNVGSLGRAYAEGSRSWGRAVWTLYRRAKRIN